jgi:prephenate dehydrogenase
MIAFAAMAHLAVAPNVRELFDYAGSGLRDFSRIAASNPEMWRDIALANRAALLAELDGFLAQCAGLREALAGGDAQLLLATFERARAAREELAKLAPPELRS